MPCGKCRVVSPQDRLGLVKIILSADKSLGSTMRRLGSSCRDRHRSRVALRRMGKKSVTARCPPAVMRSAETIASTAGSSTPETALIAVSIHDQRRSWIVFPSLGFSSTRCERSGRAASTPLCAHCRCVRSSVRSRPRYSCWTVAPSWTSYGEAASGLADLGLLPGALRSGEHSKDLLTGWALPGHRWDLDKAGEWVHIGPWVVCRGHPDGLNVVCPQCLPVSLVRFLVHTRLGGHYGSSANRKSLGCHGVGNVGRS